MSASGQRQRPQSRLRWSASPSRSAIRRSGLVLTRASSTAIHRFRAEITAFTTDEAGGCARHMPAIRRAHNHTEAGRGPGPTASAFIRRRHSGRLPGVRLRVDVHAYQSPRWRSRHCGLAAAHLPAVGGRTEALRPDVSWSVLPAARPRRVASHRPGSPARRPAGGRSRTRVRRPNPCPARVPDRGAFAPTPADHRRAAGAGRWRSLWWGEIGAQAMTRGAGMS
jgi:hypothetical protein